MNLNDDFSRHCVDFAADAVRQPSPLPGIERRMLDRVGDEIARATSVVRYAPGSRFERHGHGGGEEILVLDGVFKDEAGETSAPTWLRSPGWCRHAPFTGSEGALCGASLSSRGGLRDGQVKFTA